MIAYKEEGAFWMLQGELQGWSCGSQEKIGTGFNIPTGCPYLAVFPYFQNSSQKLTRILLHPAGVPACNTNISLPSSQDSFTRSTRGPEATWGFQRGANINIFKITGFLGGSRVGKALSDRSSPLCSIMWLSLAQTPSSRIKAQAKGFTPCCGSSSNFPTERKISSNVQKEKQ